MSRSKVEMRASDRERQETVRALRGQLRQGRLSEVTFVRRLVLALDARRRTDLDSLVADLPPGPTLRVRATRLYHRCAALLVRWMPGQPGTERGIRELALPPVPGEYVIGRGDDVDLHLDEISVSRRHALMTYICGSWVVTDLGSRNGTWVNGWRLPGPAPIRPGDVLDVGSCRFVVVDRRATTTAPVVGPAEVTMPAAATAPVEA
jgi:hypothetical protein